MAILTVIPILAPLLAAALAAMFGWRRWTATLTALAALAILVSGILLALEGGVIVDSHRLLRVDSLSVTMLLVIGAVGSLACYSSIGYIERELSEGHAGPRSARLYGTLLPLFLSAMALAVLANSMGVMWVAIEATTVVTAFLVGHRRTRAALEATWKYVIICSVGIALALLGTVLLDFVGPSTGEPGNHSLDIDVLLSHASQLDPRVTTLAAGLLLLGYGAKAGLVPFHTWLADAHSQAPSPVSALMSGVLLSVAFYALLRVKSVIDLALGTGFLRVGLATVGLLTLGIAAFMLLVQTDFKRMLAYSSMENMGLVAIAASVGTKLAIAALLLHVLAHGVAKALVFLAAGEVQAAYGSTAIGSVRGVLLRSRMTGVAFVTGLVVLLGLPPFALFYSEIGIARALASEHLGWVLCLAFMFVAVAFAALARNGVAMMLGPTDTDQSRMIVPRQTRVALAVGIAMCVGIGLGGGAITGLFENAAAILGSTS